MKPVHRLPVFLALAALACTPRAATRSAITTQFAALVDSLSEPGGYFDTDNLISNEASYLHVVDGLERLGLEGEAYIGVGPDQNFSYIAATRPSIAFIVDIRRDNMLEQLLFKALFGLATTRIEYLCLLFGRSPPPHPATWRSRDVEALLAYIDVAPWRSEATEAARRLTDDRIAEFGLHLSEVDWSTIDRFHRAFIEAGPALRFRSFGRAPRAYYPTYRHLLLERTRSGRRASYLASPEAYDVVRRLQDADRVIPVVGDLAGDHAVRAIGAYLEAQGRGVGAFYTSNVEFYLFRSGAFGAFIENVRALPKADRATIIRSVFHTTFGPHPHALPGYPSTQLLQPMDDLIDGRFMSYRQLVTSRATR